MLHFEVVAEDFDDWVCREDFQKVLLGERGERRATITLLVLISMMKKLFSLTFLVYRFLFSSAACSILNKCLI